MINMELYMINFQVDDGCKFTDDIAIVKAHNKEEALIKLRGFINSIDSETCVSKIYNVEPFTGDIMSGKYGDDMLRMGDWINVRFRK